MLEEMHYHFLCCSWCPLVSVSLESHLVARCWNVSCFLEPISYLEVSLTHLLTPASANTCYLVLYAVGIVELELESTSAFVLLIFVIPLAFTLTGFLLWILYSLNGMIYFTYQPDLLLRLESQPRFFSSGLASNDTNWLCSQDCIAYCWWQS